MALTRLLVSEAMPMMASSIRRRGSDRRPNCAVEGLPRGRHRRANGEVSFCGGGARLRRLYFAPEPRSAAAPKPAACAYGTYPSANVWWSGTTHSWSRWHPGSRLARSVTARISARDLRPPPHSGRVASALHGGDVSSRLKLGDAVPGSRKGSRKEDLAVVRGVLLSVE